MGSVSVGHEILTSRRGHTVRVSTIVFDEPVTYHIAEAPLLSYEAETIVFVDERIGGILRYADCDRALDRHAGVVKRARR